MAGNGALPSIFSRRTSVGIVLSGVLHYLSFPNIVFPRGAPFLVCFFLVPLLWALEPLRSSCRRGYVIVASGFLAHALIVQWFIPYHVFGYFFLVTLLSVQTVVFALLVVALPVPERSLKGIVAAGYLAAAWIVGEWGRQIVMRGCSWSLAHALYDDRGVLDILPWSGYQAVSFAVVVVNVAVWRLLRCPCGRRRFGGVVLVVLLLLSGALPPRVSRVTAPDVEICTVQPDIDYHAKLDSAEVPGMIRHQESLSGRCFASGRPDLIVWPETAVPVDLAEFPEWRKQLQTIVRRWGVPLLFGTVTAGEDGRLRNSAVLLGRDGEVQSVYHKRALVPFSEYRPLGWPVVVSQMLGSLHVDFAAGHEPVVMTLPYEGKEIRFGVLICSEDTVDGYFEQYRRLGVEFVVVLLNDGWFRQEAGLWIHAQHAIVAAARHRLPVIRAANTGLSLAVDARGKFVPSTRAATRVEGPAVFLQGVTLASTADRLRGGDF